VDIFILAESRNQLFCYKTLLDGINVQMSEGKNLLRE
jgi:hypothetical protein